jgi:hypothetical protein
VRHPPPCNYDPSLFVRGGNEDSDFCTCPRPSIDSLDELVGWEIQMNEPWKPGVRRVHATMTRGDSKFHKIVYLRVAE